MNAHFRRCLTVIFTFLVGNRVLLHLIGILNRSIFGGKIRNIFLLYPAHPKYASAYVYEWHRKLIKWRPALVGCYNQNGQWGLTFGVSSTEEDYKSEHNASNLQALEQKMESLRLTIGATTKTYAGILPSTLFKNGCRLNEHTEKQNTIILVCRAISMVLESQCLPQQTPVLVLGGRGYIGTDLMQSEQRWRWLCVDQQDEDSFDQICDDFKGKPLIVLNLSRQGVLRDYLFKLWQQCIVLNEVYPEPSKEEVRLLADRGILCYHIVGMRAEAWPAFPRAYQGGIPCCAAISAKSGEAIIKLLTTNLGKVLQR